MNENDLRRALKACLSDSAFPAAKQREVIRQIKGEKPIMKKKISVALVCAIMMVAALSGVALAAGLGGFGQFSLNPENDWTVNRLNRLEENAVDVNETTQVNAPEATQPAGTAETDYEKLVAHQADRSFTLTLDQSYCDGYKLYYSYTLTTNAVQTSYGAGKPTGFDEWEMASPDGKFAETTSFPYDETLQKTIEDWFTDHPDGGYAFIDSFGLGDGCALDDGSEKGTPLNIYDSGLEKVDERTWRGYQEVELPEGAASADNLKLLFSVFYSTGVYYQDETGYYQSSVHQPENRGILRIPLTVPVNAQAETLTATYAGPGYTASALLHISDVSIYGEVVFDAPEWVKSFNDGDVFNEDAIYNYMLVAPKSGTYSNLDGAYGVNKDGDYVVKVEFDLPDNTEELSLLPIYPVKASESIKLR